MMLRASALFLFALSAATAQAQRLPTSARPDHYALALAPDIAHATFAGSETIDLTLAAPSNTLILNAIELEIGSVTAAGQTGTVTFDPAKEQATLTFPQPLPAGQNAVQIAFRGILNDKLRGFYLSKTKTRNYAVTQFESTDARRAFPSFDEPAFKATFDVALTIDTRDTAISNTNILSDTPAGPGKHRLVFATTPKMSTYLVAFLVGDFQCSKGKADGVPIRVCSTPDKVALTHFAVEAAEHFLTYYDTYFGIKYPMPKLDLIGIPDFEAGAMENFGAITYRETALLLDDKESSTNARKHVAVTVAHEMAHQWFGDMVTMQWWDNLWLNEGFATWMENKAVNDWKREWHVPQDVADDLNDTLNYDAVRTTRTIRAQASTPAEISEMFDGIAYGKAGAVIGMVENWVGPEVFRAGVHNYLAAHLYANATAEDFWNAQTANAKQPVDQVMRSFVDKPCVPLLTFKDAQSAGLPLAQRRFFLSGETNDDRQDDDVNSGWTIPVCLKSSERAPGDPACKLVTKATEALSAGPREDLQRGQLFYANAAEKGYYRVAYSPAQLQAITASAETALSVPERVGFLGDRWALTRAGQGSVGDYLDLALALKNDGNSQVLDTVLATINQIRSRIATPEDKGKLDAVVRAQFGPVYAALNKDSQKDTDETQHVRSELFEELGQADDPAILARAREITESFFSQRKTIAPNLLDSSIALTAQHGTADFYNGIQTISEKADDPGLQGEAQEMLTRFRDPVLVTRTLEYATSGKVRNQDSWILIAQELGQSETRGVAWPWVQAHWDLVQAQLTTASGANLVSSTGSFCSVEQRDEVQRFFAAHKVEAAERTLSKAVDSINACIQLKRTQEPKLKVWLAAR